MQLFIVGRNIKMRKTALMIIIITMLFSSIVFAEKTELFTLADILELSDNNIVSITMHRVPYSNFETRTTSNRLQINKFINIAQNMTMSANQDNSVGGGSEDLYIEVVKNNGISYARIGNDGGVDNYSLFMNRTPCNNYMLNDKNLMVDLWLSIDANISDWAQDEINTAWLYGLTEQGQFCDYTLSITREQFCDVAANLLKLASKAQPYSAYDCPFIDVKSKNVALLWNSKIVNGKSETKFAPSDLLTREEAASILNRICTFVGLLETVNGYRYDDDAHISDWAKTDVYTIRNAGIMKGVSDDFFEPQSNITVEQATASMLRVFNQYSKSVTTIKFVDNTGNLIISSNDIVKCEIGKGYNSESYELVVYFTPGGSNKFAVATGWIAYYGSDNYITILNNNEIISSPRVFRKITDDSITISGQFSLAQATQLKGEIDKQISTNNIIDLSNVSFKMEIQDAFFDRYFGMYGEVENESAIFLHGIVERGKVQENSEIIFVDENGTVLCTDSVFKIEIIEISSSTAFRSRTQGFAESGDDVVIYLKAGDFSDNAQFSKSSRNLELIRSSAFAVFR